MNFNEIIGLLKEDGCRITDKREIIVRVLVDNHDKLLSVDDILTLCKKENDTINLTTIYRNLERLASLDLVYRKNLDRVTTGYKLVCKDSHHHHLICSECGKTVAIDYCPISSELLEEANSLGFSITNHNLDLYGVCNKCN